MHSPPKRNRTIEKEITVCLHSTISKGLWGCQELKRHPLLLTALLWGSCTSVTLVFAAKWAFKRTVLFIAQQTNKKKSPTKAQIKREVNKLLYIRRERQWETGQKPQKTSPQDSTMSVSIQEILTLTIKKRPLVIFSFPRQTLPGWKRETGHISPRGKNHLFFLNPVLYR